MSQSTLDVPTDDREKTFLFSLGNSSSGPIGMCMRVRAESLTEAVEVARKRAAGHRQTQLSPDPTYTCIYVNPAEIGPQDVGEWEYVDEDPALNPEN